MQNDEVLPAVHAQMISAFFILTSYFKNGA
jgi:hypothetical protein